MIHSTVDEILVMMFINLMDISCNGFVFRLLVAEICFSGLSGFDMWW